MISPSNFFFPSDRNHSSLFKAEIQCSIDYFSLPFKREGEKNLPRFTGGMYGFVTYFH